MLPLALLSYALPFCLRLLNLGKAALCFAVAALRSTGVALVHGLQHLQSKQFETEPTRKLHSNTRPCNKLAKQNVVDDAN
jgi:hypothetical protein